MVCGTQWLENYRKELHKRKLECKFETKESRETYRFGAGAPQRVLLRVRLPVYVSGERGHLWADVVESDFLPLLLSKQAMRQLGVRMELNTGVTEVLGRRRRLPEAKTGHTLLPLLVMEWTPRIREGAGRLNT